MPIDEKWIGDVPLNNGGVLNHYIIQIVYYGDSAAKAGVCRFQYPYILPRVDSFQLIETVLKVWELLRQNKGRWDKIKIFMPEFLFHSVNIFGETIFPSDL